MAKDFGLLFEMHIARDADLPPGEVGLHVNGDGEPVPTRRTWSKDAEFSAYRGAVEQAVLAEQAGFSHVWAVEHHFLEEYSHSSAPEVFLAYVAALTERIRIGHGVRLLPFPYNHPIKVAEQAAVLDLLCDGRLDVGTGRSATRLELEGFGIDPADTRSMWEEALRFITGAWTEPVFKWEGEHFRMPPRSVLPKPRQLPHPPLWMAGTSDESHRLAGQLGLGLLSFTLLVPPSELGRRVALYREAAESAQPVGHTANNQVAAYTLVHCAETDEEARRNVEEDILWFMRTNTREILGGFARWLDPKEPTYDYFQAFAGIAEVDVTFDLMNDNDMIIVGDPDTCARKVKQYHDECGIDQLICQMKFGSVSDAKVAESIRLFGQHVIPQFA